MGSIESLDDVIDHFYGVVQPLPFAEGSLNAACVQAQDALDEVLSTFDDDRIMLYASIPFGLSEGRQKTTNWEILTRLNHMNKTPNICAKRILRLLRGLSITGGEEFPLSGAPQVDAVNYKLPVVDCGDCHVGIVIPRLELPFPEVSEVQPDVTIRWSSKL